MKGIFPIIVVVLLLLITIAIIGFSFVFFSGVTETSAQDTEEQVEKFTTQVENFRIDNVEGNKVYIRNLGIEDLSGLNFYVNNVKVDGTGNTIEPGKTGVFTLNDLELSELSDTTNLKVSAEMFTQSKKAEFHNKNIITYWKLDEGSNGFIQDSSGQGNSGNLGPNCPSDCPEQVEGVSGFALKFDGINDFASTTFDKSFADKNQLTVELWVKSNQDYPFPGMTKTWFYYVDKSNDPFEFGFQGWSNSTSFKVYNNVGTGFAAKEPENTQLQTDVWYHYVGIVDGNIVALFKNGDLVAMRTDFEGTLAENSDSLYFASRNGASNFFNGTIDGIRILDTARSRKTCNFNIQPPNPSSLSLIFPIYNDQMFTLINTTLKSYIRDNDVFHVNSGGTGQLDVTWINKIVDQLKQSFPNNKIISSTSGLENLENISRDISNEIDTINYNYEPNFVNIPEFNWNFSTTLNNMDQARNITGNYNKKVMTSPTGRPLIRLLEYNWDYSAINQFVDILNVQTQTYCKDNVTTFQEAIDRLLTQHKCNTNFIPQITISSLQPNGVLPQQGYDCTMVVAEMNLQQLMTWWDPNDLGSLEQYLQLIGR